MIFDSVDLSDYGLSVQRSSLSSFMPPIRANYIEIADKAYDCRAYLSPRIIRLAVIVTGTGEVNLISNLDDISKLLNPVNGVKHLTLDFPDDRFYKAKVDNPIDWEIITHKLARAELSFICPDPLGYSTSETESNHSVNADPKTVTETTGGTAYIEPVYTLTAAEDISPATIKVEAVDIGEELTWAGNLSNGDILIVDVPLWIVKLNGTASMSDVSGQFPRLLPDYNNSVKITGFGSLGSLKIQYRNRFM